MREAFEQTLAAAGGSLGTWVVLNAVSDEGIVSQSVLASHANVDGATITHHIDRLEALGLVRREVDPADRRVRRISPTRAGVRLHRRMLAKARAFETTALTGLDEDDKAELRRMLAVIRSNLRAED
jgi:MarR family transcriptional regulator for hemolysin